MNENKFTLFLPPPQSDEVGADPISMLNLKRVLEPLNLKVLKFGEEHDLEEGLPILRNESTGEEYHGLQKIKTFLDKIGINSSWIINPQDLE